MRSIGEVIDAALATARAAGTKVPPLVPSEVEAAEAERLVAAGYLPYDRSVFVALSRWLASRRIDRRGLWLYGPAGTGKTRFLEFLGRPVMATKFVDVFRDRQAYDDGFWHATIRVFDSRQHDCSHLLIDDLGQEPLCVLFGQREEVLDRVLSDRYQAWKSHGVRTSVSTNLAPAELDQRYGRRITDRLREMCVPVEFSGKSLRGGR